MKKRELAEVPPGRELRDLTLSQPARCDPGEHQEELSAGSSLGGQNLPLLDVDRGAHLRNGPELAPRATREKWDCLQEIDLLLGDPMPHVTT